ncbi:MAG: alpha/beta hydrolase [Thermomicrobiales bacterium]|nr:alpha/beta hydrolase [Thermomicrobiales bacterium]
MQLLTTTANNAMLTYVEQGSGEPVIFVHGSTGDYRGWLEHVALAADRYHAIAYSRRAHFPNAWPADYVACTPEVHARDLAALILALGYGPVHLVGHSYGALISLVLASRHPELVRTLVLGEPPLFSWLATAPAGDALYTAFMAEAWAPARGKCEQGDLKAGMRIFIDGVIGEGAFDLCPAHIQAAIMANAAEMAVELATPPDAVFSRLTREDVQGVMAPTLLLTGEESPALFRVVINELVATMPHAETLVIPGVSHDLGDAAIFNAPVLAFLAKHG